LNALKTAHGYGVQALAVSSETVGAAAALRTAAAFKSAAAMHIAASAGREQRILQLFETIVEGPAAGATAPLAHHHPLITGQPPLGSEGAPAAAAAAAAAAVNSTGPVLLLASAKTLKKRRQRQKQELKRLKKNQKRALQRQQQQERQQEQQQRQQEEQQRQQHIGTKRCREDETDGPEPKRSASGDDVAAGEECGAEDVEKLQQEERQVGARFWGGVGLGFGLCAAADARSQVLSSDLLY